MLSRTLSLATVTLLIAGFPAVPALAQNQNLEAGKSPSQIFAGTCTACHKGPRGLLRTVSPSSLQGFLRQHYTSSPDMASLRSEEHTSGLQSRRDLVCRLLLEKKKDTSHLGRSAAPCWA